MPAEVTSLPVEFLFTLHAELAAPMVAAGGPRGTRVVVGVTGGRVTGPKVNGAVVAPGGDWLYLGADGSMNLDVRVQIVTDDGATILMSYLGRGAGGAIRTAPYFETGDERYTWLNGVQGIATGTVGENSVTYEVYRVL